MSVYDFSVKDAQQNEVSLREYAGKVLLIVNTATHCGYTPQYNQLQELYEKYHDQGLEILDFPCNQFLKQAPEAIDEYVSICQLKFHTTFKIFNKIDVNGKNADPLYQYLTQGTKIRWNFTKFLIDREGTIIKRFDSKDTPLSFEQDIVALL